MDLFDLILFFIFYSFIGFIIETIYVSIQEKKFVNRGFLIGPWCPIYGVGALILLLINNFKYNAFLVFFVSLFLFSILEYLTSFIMEKLFKARWWDYSDRTLNINGRICIGTMIPFGIIGLLAIYVFNPLLLKFFKIVPHNIIILIAFLFILDFLFSLIIISSIKITAKKYKKDNTEEISDKVKEVLLGKKYPKRRIIRAFPNLNIK